MDIILYLLQIIQQLYQQNIWLINYICKYIPLRQWAFDDSHSPKYQKFKIDELPIVEKPLPKLSWKKIIDEYFKMIENKEYDADMLEEAVAFKNVYKQANRIKCATIGWNAMNELLEKKEDEK